MTRLYELTGELVEIRDMIESGELSHDEIKDQLEATTLQWEDKAKGVLIIRQEALGACDVIKAEIDRLKSLMDAHKSTADWLTDYLRDSMIALGKDKADLGVFKVTLRKASQMVVIDDEDQIPSEYFEIIPETKRLDKKALLAAVKLAEESLDPIKGCHLEDAKRGLLVK